MTDVFVDRDACRRLVEDFRELQKMNPAELFFYSGGKREEDLHGRFDFLEKS